MHAKYAKHILLAAIFAALGTVIVLRLQTNSAAAYDEAAELNLPAAADASVLESYDDWITYLSSKPESEEVVVLSSKEAIENENYIEVETEPKCNERYADIVMTDEELRELASIIYLEAGNQTAEGQQAVAEVILNRVISGQFPNNVHDVLHQGEGSNTPQFSTIGALAAAQPSEAQYDAIHAALYEENILPEDVVYFSRGAENDNVWGQIGDHIFCYKYTWG